MGRRRRRSRSAATARGWPSRAGSGTSPSSMWRRGERSRPPVSLAFPATIALNKNGTRLGVGTFGVQTSRSSTLPRARRSARRSRRRLRGQYRVQQRRIADGRRHAAAEPSGSSTRRPANGSALTKRCPSPLQSPIGLGFTPDDTTLLVASERRRDRAARPRRAPEAGASSGRPPGWIATFSPDGTRFAVPIDGSDNDTAIVDVATGKLLQTLHPARRFPNWENSSTAPLRGRLQPERTGGCDRLRRVRRPAGRDRGVLRGRRVLSPPPPRARCAVHRRTTCVEP